MSSMLRPSVIALSRFNCSYLKQQLCTSIPNYTFKSAVSLDNVYPESNQDFLRRIEYEVGLENDK